MTGMLERAAVAAFHRWLEPDTRVKRLLLRRSAEVQRGVFVGTLLLYPPFLILSWLGTGGRRLLGRKPRILWAPTPILTIAESSSLLRRLGYPSTTLVFTTYYIRSDFDINVQTAVANPAVSPWLPNVLFLWSLLRFDLFHFFYDGGLWSGMKIVPRAKWLELPLLRLAGKRVIASAYGADVRVRHLNEMWQPYNICRECPAPGVHCICDTSGVKNAKYYGDWCNVVLAMGDMSDFVFGSRRDVNYWPIDVATIDYVGAVRHEGPVRVVHSPNHREFKGTRFLERAIESLRSRGVDVELDIVQGVPNDEAKARYARADIVFAQCLAGWIGYTEIEAMAAGKPVITYIRDPGYLRHTGPTPLVSASPAQLEEELEALIVDPGRREELGLRGREYVERAWSYEALAPVYESLHREVWEHNRLARCLRGKWLELRRGEPRFRVGRPLHGTTLREWPVHADAALTLRRIESGIYGQPPLDGSGVPRVWLGDRYIEHPGVTALFALNAFQLGLEERFLAAAARLRDALVVDEAGVGRWETVSFWTQALGVSALLRASQAAPADGYAEAAAAAANLFRVPAAEEGLLGSDADPLDGFISGLFALYEYHRVSGAPWANDELERGCSRVLRLLSSGAPAALRPDPTAAALVGDDSEQFVAAQLRALHRMTGERSFLRHARRRRREVVSSRLKAFVRLEEPI